MNQESKEEGKSKPKTGEEQKQDLAKIYGISLKDIEHVRLENGKEFFKFYNPNDQSIRMVENIEYGINLSKSFKNIQQELSYTQGDDSRENAREIYEHNMKHKNVELNLISIAELKFNKHKYKKQIDGLSTIDRKKLITLLKYSKELELTHINIENAIAIDEHQNVIDLQYDYAKNKAVIKTAQVINYEDKKEFVDEEDFVVDLSDDDFDKIVDEIIVSDDNPIITDGQEINVRGERIDPATIKFLSDMPEAESRLNLNPKQSKIYHGIIEAINRRKAKKTKKNQPQKKYVYKNNQNNHGGTP